MNISLVRLVHMGVRDDEVLLQRGLPVVTKDDQVTGRIDHLVLDPVTRRAPDLVVERGGLLNQQLQTEPSLGWHIKERSRTMRRYKRKQAAVNLSRLLAYGGNHLELGLPLATLS